MKNTITFMILVFFVSPAVVPVYSTQTYLINEIDADVIREVFSSKDIIKKINELAQTDYIWADEFVHVGSGECAFYHFTLFFEKNNLTKVLRFDYLHIDKKVSEIEILTGDEYKKSMGTN